MEFTEKKVLVFGTGISGNGNVAWMDVVKLR